MCIVREGAGRLRVGRQRDLFLLGVARVSAVGDVDVVHRGASSLASCGLNGLVLRFVFTLDIAFRM
jgi:hypothetical protein